MWLSFDELFQFRLVLIGFTGLIIQIIKKEVTAPAKECGYFL